MTASSLMTHAARALLSASIAICPLGSTARADVSTAARAFADGQSAQLEGDYDHAAQSFELAFSNAPSKEALRSAVRARKLAGQLARAATLAEVLLVQYGSDTTSAKLAGEVIAEARLKLGRVTVTCSAKCSLAVDARAVSMPPAETLVLYLQAGHHTIEATFEDGRSAARELAAVTGANDELELEPPRQAAGPAPVQPEAKPPAAQAEHAGLRGPPPSGLRPFVPLTGGAIAVGLAGVGIWSGFDTNKAHDAYLQNPTHDAFTQGRSKQLRTNILLGSAIAVGLTSAVVAIWWTRWGSDEAPPAVSLAPTTGGGLVTYGASF
jgi:F0F1-type ATP synthase membrane subunit c/vacuolar-type H+-ATPase subunit K